MNHFSCTFIGAILALGLASQAAIAHSSKEGTRPNDGAVLTTSPEKVGMTFDMLMRVTLVSLTDQDGKDHALTLLNDPPYAIYRATLPIDSIMFL